MLLDAQLDNTGDYTCIHATQSQSFPRLEHVVFCNL